MKTYNGALNVDIDEVPHQILPELVKAQGKATGNITTAQIQDAIPAALYSPITDSQCYGPEMTSQTCKSNALENSGQGPITGQLLQTRADLILDDGAQNFNECAKADDWQDKTLVEQAEWRGY
ncbi:alkaline phosphatase [Utexia brackfieldae]|uniref:alkaline phosphatase n=1 Tax=Utexia brackfieldae TaxID=3074108 RepID=UPI00370D7455